MATSTGEPTHLKKDGVETGHLAFAGRSSPDPSPDRAHAMAWAKTVLSETKSGVPRVRRK